MPCHETAGGDEITVGTNIFGEVLLHAQDRQGNQARAVLSSLDVEILIACLAAASPKVNPAPAPCAEFSPSGICRFSQKPCPYKAGRTGNCSGYKKVEPPTPAIDQQARNVIDGWAERLLELQRKVFRVDDQLQNLIGHLLREKMSPEEAAEAAVKSVKAAEARVRMADGLPEHARRMMEEAEKAVRTGGPRDNVSLLSPREMCSRHHVQACHCCERLACCDNTSPGADLFRAAKKWVETPSGTDGAVVPGLMDAVKKLEEMG
jgi:hypothetical protein